MKKYLAVSSAIGFGILFIYLLITEDRPSQDVGLAWDTVCSIVFIILGTLGLRDKSYIEKQQKDFTRLYEKTGSSMYKEMAREFTEPYMKPFAKVLMIDFILIGIVMLLKHYTNLF